MINVFLPALLILSIKREWEIYYGAHDDQFPYDYNVLPTLRTAFN